MKKRILFSIMTIALVGALIGGGIFAYFSDVETSTANTFTAGTLDLEVDTENPWTSTPITVTCMEPGAAASAAEIAAGARADDVSANITLSCTSTGLAPVEVSGIDAVHLSAVPTTWTLIKDDLAENVSITLSLGGSLDSGTGNEYQGDESTFDIELYLAQDGQTPS